MMISFASTQSQKVNNMDNIQKIKETHICDSCYSAYRRGEIKQSEIKKPDFELNFGFKQVYLCQKHLGEWHNKIETALWQKILRAFD